MNDSVSTRSAPKANRRHRLPWLVIALMSTFLSFSPVGAQKLSLTDAWTRFLEHSPLAGAEREKIQMALGRLSQSQVWDNPTLQYSQEGYPVGLRESGYDDQEFLISAWQEFEVTS